MTFKTAISSLIFGLGCYLLVGLISIAGTVLWLFHILGQIPSSSFVEKKAIVKEFGEFLASDNKGSLNLQRQANLLDTKSLLPRLSTDTYNSNDQDWLSREDHREMLDNVRACLRGEDNKLLMTLLVVNYPRAQLTEGDYEYSQRIITAVREQWVKLRESFEIAVNNMSGVEVCDGQRLLLEDVIASAAARPDK